MKKAVLFDLFGTLAPSPPLDGYRNMVDSIAAILDLPSNEFYEKWMSVNSQRLSGEFGSSEGDIDHVAGLFEVSMTAGQMAEAMQSRRNAMHEWVKPKPGAVEALTELTSSGIKLALVSDCVFDVPAIWPKTELGQFFDTTVFSCEQKVRKPHRLMYETALEGLQASTDEAIFVGDGGSNELEGAHGLGIYAFLLDDKPKYEEVLRVDVSSWNGPSISGLHEVSDVIR